MEVGVAIAVVGWVAVISIGALAVRREVRRRREVERQLESLSWLTDPALARLAPDELFAELLSRTRRVLEAQVAALLMSDDDSVLRVRAVSGATPVTVGVTPVEAGMSLAARVAASAEPVLVSDVDASQAPAPLDATAMVTLRSFLGCPLLVDGEVCGVLALGSASAGAFTTEDLRLVRRVADRFAGAVDRARFDEAEREAQEAIEESEHRIRTVIDAAPIGIVEATTDGETLRWNRAAADLLGWPRWLVGAAQPGALPTEVDAALTSAAAGQRAAAVSVAIEREDARGLQIVVSASPVTDLEGNIEGVLVLLDDVTDRQQLEQHIRQAQRLEAMARLAGGVAHDFNNLLTVIRGYSEVLLKTLAADDERREDVDAILVAAEGAASLTKQLLTIGRRQPMEPEVIDVHERVRELTPVLERLVDRSTELRVVIGSASGPGHVRVMPGDFDQAVMNLVNNARDAMPDGGRIMVETRTIEMRARGASLAGVTAGRYVLVTVADTGTGMDKDVLEHCFDPFFSTKSRGKGTGLGLALVYGTATQGGGHATVESEPGRGTTFRLWFPEVDPASAEPLPVATRPRRRRVSGQVRKARVLLVDDEAPVRSLVRATLEEAGHEVIEAGTGEEALAKGSAPGAADQTIDVLVSDVVLGGMNGDELAVKLRKLWPGLRVLLMSGFSERALMIEPDAFVAKPFALDELAAIVGELASSGPAPPARRRPAKKAAPRR